jgi:hypothetical protein
MVVAHLREHALEVLGVSLGVLLQLVEQLGLNVPLVRLLQLQLLDVIVYCVLVRLFVELGVNPADRGKQGSASSDDLC